LIAVVAELKITGEETMENLTSAKDDHEDYIYPLPVPFWHSAQP
jgi:hypothetical protein